MKKSSKSCEVVVVLSLVSGRLSLVSGSLSEVSSAKGRLNELNRFQKAWR